MVDNSIRTYIATGVMLLATSTAGAQSRPIPESQWTRDTHIWLARAMVAEAGWKAERDHIAIAYVLARRWRRLTENWPSLRFIDVIRNYCAGLGDYTREFTARQRWLRGLSWTDDKPEGWPRAASWPRHLPLWRNALELSARWSEGGLRDPCRGRAWHWGGTIDTPQGRMVALNCGKTRNTYYRVEPVANRASHAVSGKIRAARTPVKR
jgi:hypothetical protein